MSSPETQSPEPPELRSHRFGLLHTAHGVFSRRETTGYLIRSNLKAGHRDKLLGNLWSLLEPLLFMGVYYLVFGLGFRQAGDNPIEFVIYLSIGFLTFRFTEGCAAQAATCVRANQGLVAQVPFPKAILPVALCVSRLYDFVWGLTALLIALPFLDHTPTLQAAWLLALLPLQLLFCMGLAYVVAWVGVFFLDTSNIVAIIMRLLFFLSPIFYFATDVGGRKGLVPPDLLPWYRLNPLVGFMDGYRDALLWGRAPTPEALAQMAAVSLGCLLIGFILFARAEGQYAKYV